ncbi:MAG: archease [Bacteroidetes bacterium]|nr:archease [Bacteroidota bacterium]
MSYEFLDHISDIGVRVKSTLLESAFEESAFALLHIIFGKDRLENLESRGEIGNISISGIDREALLINFLNEILYLIDAKKIYPSGIRVKITDENNLSLKFDKNYFDLENHPINLYVKAVTYHQLKIVSEKDAVQIEYFVDI